MFQQKLLLSSVIQIESDGSEEEIVNWLIKFWLRILMSTERPVFLIALKVVLCASWHSDGVVNITEDISLQALV